MKKLFRISAAIVAALVSLAACQKANEVENQAPKLTHSVKFTTDLPTKTSYEIDGSTVNYKWEDKDLYRLHVYEDGIEGTIDVEKSAIDETYVMLTVNFEGSGEGVHTYTANLNEGIIKSNQVADGKYDSDSDVLVAKPVSSDEIVEDYYTFRFRRPVAITELKLKNLKAEEKVSKVTIVSDAVHPLVGTYTQSETDAADGTWGEKSNKIVVTFGTEQDGETPKTKTVESDGSLIVPIVSMPVENASVKVLVETENGLKYRKVTSAALTLTANNVKSRGIGLTQVTEAEHAEDGWYLVTDASELFDGDEIRIACPAKGMIAGEFAVDSEKGTQDYLAAYAATFTPETYDELTGVDSENKPNTFKLVENYGSFALVNENGKLGATDAKKMSYDDGTGSYSGVTDWTIAIDDNSLASIEVGDKGRIQCNVTYSRFLNYTSDPQSNQLLPQIYKKYGDAQDPIIKTKRTASFNPATATVTINADDNVFPELSFEPAGATEGTRTWTSSNTEVATINETTGEVTLVSDGTTTIKVEIAESDTYQPCSAEYVLTVKPAEVEGVDYLNRAWTGVSDGATSYSSWTGKTGSKSGNTYAGNSAGSNNAIQLRYDTGKTPSGIIVTASKDNKVARKITVDWESHTSNGRTLNIYGKSTKYSTVSDLYSNNEVDTQGTKLGSIDYGTSTELEITEDYEFIGIRSNSGALYLNWIKIQWEDAKPKYEACFKDAGGTVVTEVNATVGEVFTAPTLYKGATPSFANAYESSNTEVATVNEVSGAVTLKKKGDAVITATLNGDDTHKTTEVSYTIHVANKLSSIKLADDSEQPTTFYVGQDFSFAGIKVEATYTDGEEKTLADADLDADNFSGFDSSAAVESQTITVSYTDGATKTTTYNVEIKPLVTLYGITVPAEDANGNSITVKGGLTEAPEGGEIELNVNLNTEKGYKLTSLKVNEVEHSADVAEGKYTFTMPAEAVTVTAEFDNHYTVTIEQPSANGTVKVQNATTSPQSIACGETVSVLAEPATGYELDSWTVNGAELTDATKASTSFTMPANDVTITASFKEFSYLVPNGKYVILAKRSSGNYFYMSSDLGTASTKRFQAKISGNDNLPVGSVSTSDETIIWTVNNSSSGITLMANTGKKASWTSGNSAALDDTGKVLNVSLNEDGSVKLSFVNGTETRTLALNNQSGNDYFAFYTGSGITSLYFIQASIDNTPKLTLNKENISGVSADGVTNATESEVYTIENANDSDIAVSCDNSIVTSASVTDGTLKYSVSKNTGEARNGWVKLTFNSEIYTITIKQSAAGGETVIWTRVTTIAELTAGGTFIMGYEATAKSGVIVPLRSADCNAKTTANGYFFTGTTASSSTNGTIDMSKLTESADYEVYISSPASGKINIQMKDKDGSYYGATSGGSTKNSGRLYTSGNSAETNLTPEFSSETNNQFKLTSDVTGQYKYLKYNTGSPRFAYYNSAGSNIVFYKKSNN